MSRTPWAITEYWKDYAGMWNPAVEPWIAPLGLSKCHAARLVQLPPLEQSFIAAKNKLEYNLRLVPGSVIYGIEGDSGEGSNPIQLTDVGVGHALFQEPTVPNFTVDGGLFLLPCPWPVTGDGLFTFEAWNNSTDPVRCRIQLLMGEVTTCPIR